MSKAIIRDDNKKCLGTVGNIYEIINNSEAFAFFDSIVGDNKASYKKYQEFNGGKKVCITARFNEKQAVNVGDEVGNQIQLINSFDGSTSFKVILSVLRLVCTNGMVSNSKEHIISIRHSKSKDQRMQQAFQVLGKSQKSFEIFMDNARQMAQKSIDVNMVDTFINELLSIDPEKDISTKKQNAFDAINELVYTGKGNKGESVWDLYNGVTEYYDHVVGSNSDARVKSSMFSNGFKQKDKALNMALDLSK